MSLGDLFTLQGTLFAMILVAAGAIFLLSGPKVEKELTLEAGSKMPAVTDFLKKDVLPSSSSAPLGQGQKIIDKKAAK